jgi:hypothetical protein
MRPRALLALAAIVVALAAFILLFERKQPSPEQRTRQAKRVFAVDSSAVRWLRIEHGGKIVRLERVERVDPVDRATVATEDSARAEEESEWRLREPIDDRADRWEVQKLLDSLTSLERQRDLPDVDPATLGLDRPRVVVTLGVEAGETTLEIGAELPVGDAMAAAVRGQRGAAVIANTVFAELTRDAGTWRSREVVAVERDRILRLTLTPSGGAAIVLSRAKGGDAFRLTAPFADRADREKVDALIAELTALRVESFLESPAGAGDERLAAGPGSIEIGVAAESTAGPLERVEIGELAVAAAPTGAADAAGAAVGAPGAAEHRVLRAGGRTFSAETRLAETLGQEAARWRSPAWSAAEVYRVEAVELRGLGEAVDLRRVDGEWKRGDETVDTATVSDLLTAVTGAQAEAILDRAQAEARGAKLAQPRVTIMLQLGEGVTETLRAYGALPGGQTPVMASDRDAVLLLPAGALQAIESKLAAVRQAKGAATP